MRRARALVLVLLAGLLLAMTPRERHTVAGEEAWRDGDLAAALEHWSRALEDALEEGDTDAQGDLLLRLAAVQRDLGRLADAGGLLDRAEALADTDGERARALDARGLLALEAGDPRRAERLLARAFGLHQGAEDPAGAANAAVNLGVARKALGHWEDADRALTGAATLFTSLDDPRGTATALTTRGAVRRHQGRYAEAREDLEQATGLYETLGDRRGLAAASTNLGLVLQDLGRFDEAKARYEAALAQARERRDVGVQATLQLNLATLAHHAGELDEAEDRYRAAEAAYASLGRHHDAASASLGRALLRPDDPEPLRRVLEGARKADDAPLEASAALNLAAVLRYDEPSEAGRLAARALRLADDLELPDARWRARYLLGVLAKDAGRGEAAVEHLRAAVDELERRRKVLSASESSQFVTGHEPVYQALIDALLRQGDSLGAFVYAERLQLVSLDEVPLPPDATAARYQALVAEEAYLSEALSSELASQRVDRERAEALKAQLARLRVEFAATVDELRSSYDDFDQLVRVDPEDLEAVQGELDPDVLVLQPILFEDRLVLLVFSRESLAVRQVDADPAEVGRTVRRLARLMQKGDVYHDPELVRRLCDQVGQWLVAPIARDLEGKEVLVVSASGTFRQLPFALLRHGGRYLAQDVAVVHVTHVGSLRRRGAAEARFRLAGTSALLVGNPDGSLPAAEEEVRAIARTFSGASVLVGEQASREAVYEEIRGKTALHLATHGVIDPIRPERSHLVLGAGDAGHLTYREIPGLAPWMDHTRLVVLSACQSGLPVEAAEREDGGVVISINGLAAQFRRAGVESLVASLWRVDDEGTRTLMEGFYAELSQGRDLARALQASQVAMIEDPEWSDPWYWAAFALYGDWR